MAIALLLAAGYLFVSRRAVMGRRSTGPHFSVLYFVRGDDGLHATSLGAELAERWAMTEEMATPEDREAIRSRLIERAEARIAFTYATPRASGVFFASWRPYYNPVNSLDLAESAVDTTNREECRQAAIGFLEDQLDRSEWSRDPAFKPWTARAYLE
ncbi:MAG: hypothetical protein K8E66_02055, partial [Phycisphaerales bacterium]|nr:hypothetical protein [Phycisphaerales bacterium]